MAKYTLNGIALLIILLTPVSVNQWSEFPISNTTANWILYSVLLFLFISGKKYYFNINNNENFVFIKLYTFWVVICSLRGLIESEYYWDYKSLMNAGFALMLVFSIYVFSSPFVLRYILNKWIYIALPLFLIFVFFIASESFGFYLILISLIALFLPVLNVKWKILIFGISLFIILIDFDARSNVIKFLVPVLLSYMIHFKKTVNSNYFKLVSKLLFIAPIVLLLFALTGFFNIFKLDEYVTGEYSQKKIVAGEYREINLKVDTRTFIYEEVINSALKNNYVLFGRTPARGYDSNYFGEHAAEELGTGRYERYNNEVSILNIFTWTGMTGVVLYFFLFYKAASLALYKSNNVFVKIIGMYVSFRWAYAWIEDFNRFDIMNIMLWMVIALCYSKQFRDMSDKEFTIWVKSIFTNKTILSRA